MAPHAIIDLNDSSGYTPSPVNLGKPSHPNGHYEKSMHVGCFGCSASQSKSAIKASKIYNACALRSPCLLPLSNQEIQEVEQSVVHFRGLDLPLNAISKRTFPLTDAFQSRLKAVLKAIYHGKQYMILCGLDPRRYTDVDNVIIHAGIASHIGDQRGLTGREGGDNTAVHHIIAIEDCPKGSSDQYHGPPNQARDIPFHTDNGDIISLYALSTSSSGGNFYLADVTAVYDDLAIIAPKLAKCLTDEWSMVSASPTKLFDSRPIAFPHHASGRTLLNCSRSRITGTPSAPRPSSLPPLTTLQKRALDTLHHLAIRHAVEIELHPGDMVFFNNLSMMHARDAFVDNVAMGQKRHLLRLILRNEEMAYKLPTQLEETWKGLYDHDPKEEVFPVEKELFTFAATH